jgi:YidC/Oxa1 family membrane protein insertase
MVLPFFFVTFVIRFPAGLMVYWITTNLWTIVQQTIIKRRLGPLRPPTPAGEKPPTLMEQLGIGGARQPATVGVGGDGPAPRSSSSTGRSGSEPKGRAPGPPPNPPRKKKKRSGRRR